MTTWAVLEISDGTPGGTVNLLSGGATGFHLKDWNPQVIQPKEGGVFQDSPIAPGRRLVYAVDATAVESMTIDVNDYDEDSLIEQAQDLMRLLNKARAYGGTTDWQDTPVYIRARADCETNDRFAVIINWAIPELDNPYAPPFVVAGEIALMDDLTLQLERGHWTANAPGVGTCVQVSNQQVWDYGLTITQVSTTPTEVVTGFTQHGGSGALYATASENRIMKSVDNGATWANNLTGAPLNANDDLLGIICLANNNLLAYGNDGGGTPLIRSTNDGGAWSDVSIASMSVVARIIQISATGTVLAGGSDGAVGSIWRSTDNGANWTQVLDNAGSGGPIDGLAVAANGDIIAGYYNQSFFISTDDGQTWTQLTSGYYPDMIDIILASDGNLYTLVNQLVANKGAEIWKSIDNGQTWQTVYQNYSQVFFQSLIESPTADGVFWAVAIVEQVAGIGTSQLWKSTDYGASWQPQANFITDARIYSGGTRHAVFEAADGRIYAGTGKAGNGYIYRSGVSATITLGRAVTCLSEVYVANRHNIANITHIYRDDGGVFTSIFPAALPVTLFPAVPAANDALYVGIQSSTVDAGPFGGIIFDIGTIMSGVYTLIWEYWSGAAWSTLTVWDGTNYLTIPGVNSVHWVQPSNWATTAVNGVTAYWVRARLSVVTSILSVPTQQNRDIYAVNRAMIDVDQLQVLGDIAALMQAKINNRSDFNGPEATGPNLYENRLVCGLRSLSLGSGFTAYLNIADRQNQAGVIIDLGTNTTFADDAGAPSGRRATYNPGGVEAMATRITVGISPAIARDFYGTFHAYLRAKRTAGVSTDLTVRLQVATGSGGITFTTVSQQLQTTTAFEVLDFGEITLPVSSSFKSSDLADTTEIRIQASAASGTPDLYLYDLILIPVDEWAVDAVDMANESDSDVGRSNYIAKLLDIDSVTDPRIDIKTLVKTADASEFITAEYNPICGGPAILQANVDQQLWFFAMMTSATGAAYSWLAPPEIAHSIQLWTNPRYLGMRGSR